MIQCEVIIALYNSSTFIRDLRKNLAELQEIGRSRGIEVSVTALDGGSTDTSAAEANAAGWTVIENRQGDPVSAKQFAISQSDADYLLFLDHDEGLNDPAQTCERILFLEETPNCLFALVGGYEIKPLTPCNSYASEFGDAFSATYYLNSNRLGRRANGLSTSEVSSGGRRILLSERVESSQRVLLEPVATAGLVHRRRLLTALEGMMLNGKLVGHFALAPAIIPDGYTFAIFPDEGVSHNPGMSWPILRKKARWRAWNAMREPDQSIGISSRIASKRLRFAKFVFVIKALTVVPVIVDAISMSVRSRKFYVYGHLFLTYGLLWDGVAIAFGGSQRRYGH